MSSSSSSSSSSLLLGSLSKDVLERRTSTGSEAFFSFICLDSNKFVLLSFFSLIKRIYARVWTKPLPNDAKSPLPVDVRRSKTLLLKLSISSIILFKLPLLPSVRMALNWGVTPVYAGYKVVGMFSGSYLYLCISFTSFLAVISSFLHYYSL